MASDLFYWLEDAAKILGQNGTTDHADKVREAMAKLRKAMEVIEEIDGMYLPNIRDDPHEVKQLVRNFLATMEKPRDP